VAAQTLVPCPEPHYVYGSVYLTRPPRNNQAPVSYCPRCLGFGTLRNETDVQPEVTPSTAH